MYLRVVLLITGHPLLQDIAQQGGKGAAEECHRDPVEHLPGKNGVLQRRLPQPYHHTGATGQQRQCRRADAAYGKGTSCIG